jgi:hypothetical protein
VIASTLAAIAWDPEIRNILGLLTGLILLCGSVYLLLATNTGARLGLLITLAGLFGWMTIMGIIWWIYGIGMLGEAAHWQVRDIFTGEPSVSAIEPVHRLPERELMPDPGTVVESDTDLAAEFEGRFPTLGDLIEVDPSLVESLELDDRLNGWELLATADSQRGDAVASADAALGGEGQDIFTSTSDYKVIDVFSYGGKPRLEEGASLVERVKHKLLSIWHWQHPTHYAVVQVQPVEPVEVEVGEAPPTPQVDPDAPVFSVVLERDLGDRRFPAAMVTLAFGLLFLLTCWRLHERDKLIAARRRAATS